MPGRSVSASEVVSLVATGSDSGGSRAAAAVQGHGRSSSSRRSRSPGGHAVPQSQRQPRVRADRDGPPTRHVSRASASGSSSTDSPSTPPRPAGAASAVDRLHDRFSPMGATHAEVELLLEEHGGHAGRAARVLRARHPGPAGQGVSPLPVTESNPLHDGPQSSMGPPASEVVSLVAPRSDSKRYQAEAGAAGLVEHQRDGKLAGGRLVPQPQPEPEPQPR